MTALVPPGGWAFLQDGETITGSNDEDLVAQVINFRVDRRLPLGNPEQEVEDQICAKYPQQCNPRRTEQPPSTFIPKTLHDRVMQWAANRYERAGSIAYVSQDEADRRAGICSQCPKNELNWMNNCAPCRDDIQRTLLLVRQGKNTDKKMNLGACNIAGHDNNSAAFLPEKLLKHRVRYEEELPDFCWLHELN